MTGTANHRSGRARSSGRRRFTLALAFLISCGLAAGSWLVNEAAHVVAKETSASIHLTFLDAYVPQGWDEKSLGWFVGDPCETCWAEHYFTRDPLNLTENVLTWACNVDVTDVNPGFKGHKFPWHWYLATISGRYEPSGRFGGKDVYSESGGIRYGYARSREAGGWNWPAGAAIQGASGTVEALCPR